MNTKESIESKFNFTLNHIHSLGLDLDKTWLYRNCPHINTRITHRGIENVYTIESVRKALTRKREELKKNYSSESRKRQKSELKLNKIEDTINKIVEYLRLQ